jgi:hypothetical protein
MIRSVFNRTEGRILLIALISLFAVVFLSVSFYLPRECKSEDSETEYRNQSFADFLYLTNNERDIKDSVIYFYTPDTIDGLVHSNDTIRIQGDGVFPRRVTTSVNYIYPPNNRSRFIEGWGYRAPILFPDLATEIRRFNGITPVLGTHDPDSITQIVFSDTFLYVRYCGPDPAHNNIIHCTPDYLADASRYAIPHSGALFINGKVWISASRNHGDLMDGPYPDKDSLLYHQFVSNGFEGQLTVATSDTLIITDNLVYKHAKTNYYVPSTMDSCSDILGLISERFIMIGKQARSATYINAALAAIRGSISVEDIYDYYHDSWKQSLFIYGSLAQRNRGKMHTGEINHERGFREKNYHYDLRFQDNPPPHFLKTETN